VKTDWQTVDMPEEHASFILHRMLSEADAAVLKMGNIPQQMEDKWFWYCEGNTLYAHRSWTGYKDLNWACGWHLDDDERKDISNGAGRSG